MQFVALIILVASVYVGFSSRIKTSFIDLHLLWVAATGASLFLLNGIKECLAISMMCAILFALIHLAREMHILCRDE
jgi:hypothetical protein